jgi:hypothetical protein
MEENALELMDQLAESLSENLFKQLSTLLQEKDEKIGQISERFAKKEKDLEMAVQVGRSLLKKNEELSSLKLENANEFRQISELESRNAELQVILCHSFCLCVPF